MGLNLLPPEEIKEAKYLFLRQYLRIITVLIITAEILFGTILFGIFFFLSEEYNKEKKNVELQSRSVETEEIKINEQKINDFNSYLSRLTAAKDSHVNWIIVIENIVKNRSEEIKIDSITINDGSKKISVKGTAQTRESFIKFKDELEKISYFNNFDSPINNIINPTNIIFSLDFTVKTEEINKQ